MDDRFREYFSQRVRELEDPERFGAVPALSERERHPVADEAARAALDAARTEASDTGVELREDAQLVLLLLAYELVARPVSAARPQDSRGLAPDLTDDARLLVRRAAKEAPGPEVSAHRVVNALSQVWDELRSGDYRLWDR